jgi:hypothetical protein
LYESSCRCQAQLANSQVGIRPRKPLPATTHAYLEPVRRLSTILASNCRFC